MTRTRIASILTLLVLVTLTSCTKITVTQTLKSLNASLVDISEAQVGVGSSGCNVVFITDNSGSMSDEQTDLATAVQTLVQLAPTFTGANLRFFGLTTDFYLTTGQVDSRSYVDLRDANFQTRLQALLQPGIQGNGSERFHQSVQKFLGGNANQTILREPCFAFVVVTDEAWQLNTDLPAQTVQVIQNFIANNFTVPDVAATYFVAAVYDPATDTTGKYAELVTRVGNGSFTHSIRTTDWANKFFEVLGNRVQQVLKRTNSYSFSIVPCVIPESVRVSISVAGGSLQTISPDVYTVGPDLHKIYLDPTFVNSLQTSTKVMIQYFTQFCPSS